jgi:hypothetical protein
VILRYDAMVEKISVPFNNFDKVENSINLYICVDRVNLSSNVWQYVEMGLDIIFNSPD